MCVNWNKQALPLSLLFRFPMEESVNETSQGDQSTQENVTPPARGKVSPDKPAHDSNFIPQRWNLRERPPPVQRLETTLESQEMEVASAPRKRKAPAEARVTYTTIPADQIV